MNVELQPQASVEILFLEKLGSRKPELNLLPINVSCRLGQLSRLCVDVVLLIWMPFEFRRFDGFALAILFLSMLKLLLRSSIA